MYRCHACLAVVGPWITRRLHVVYRTVREPWKDPRQEIAAEYPVCRRCQELLARGVSVTTVRRQTQARRSQVVVEAAPLLAAASHEDVAHGRASVLPGHHPPAVAPAASASWWSPPAAPLESASLANGLASAPSPPRAVCDLCGKQFTDGQSIADAVICASCIKKGER